MKCRSCGLEIADKAIVCYRCGTPTADLPAPRPKPRRQPIWPAGLAILLIIGLGAWLIPRTPAGTPERWGVWIALAVVLLVGAVWLRRRRLG